MTMDGWLDFAASGKISDYLKYREQVYLQSTKTQETVSLSGVEHGADDCPDRHGVIRDACG